MILFCYFYDKNLKKRYIKAHEIFKNILDAIKYIKNSWNIRIYKFSQIYFKANSKLSNNVDGLNPHYTF